MKKADIIVVGGGLGGVAAALAACEQGLKVVLTEETDWLGGQLTSQAVPPDENLWIERGGCTRSYATLRERMREIYRTFFPLNASARQDSRLNPGHGLVSTLCTLPEVGALALREMLLPWIASGSLVVYYRFSPESIERNGTEIRSITLRELNGDRRIHLSARYFLDATDLGDLIALAGVSYVTGTESQEETGELHAPTGPSQPDDVQAFTWCLPLAYNSRVRELRDEYAIPKPAQYQEWKAYHPKLSPAWSGALLSLRYSHPPTCRPIEPPLFSPPGDPKKWSLWSYRRILSPTIFTKPEAWHEVSLINWPQNDYFKGGLIDVSPDKKAQALKEARELSLSLAYWLQNEAPRPDGGCGYAGLHLRPDITDTPCGLAKAPYIRESRRIRARFTITEQHVGAQALGWKWPDAMEDSVGIGFYPIDLHPTTGGRNYLDIPSYPFQIPLGALIPQMESNLIPAAKNIGTTHITNGCYRLHPVEWNIGEAAGTLAALCIQQNCTPHQVDETPALRADLQSRLVALGVPLAWSSAQKAEYDHAILQHPDHPSQRP